MGAEFALLLKICWISQKFLDSVSTIDAYFWNIWYSFWGPISKRNTTRRGSHHRRGFLPRRGFLHTRGSLHEHCGTRAPGISGHIVFLRGGSYAAFVLAGVLCQESVPQSEVYSIHTPLRWGRRPFQNWILLFLLENIVLPRPVSNEVSFPFSSFCSVLFFPGSFPTQLLKPFLLHFGGGFTILDCSVTARTLSLLILEV